MLDSTPRFPEEVPFIRHRNIRTEVIDAEIVDDLVREVMDIDDDIIIPRRDEFGEYVVQQRLAADGHERLRHRIRDGFQAGPEPRGKDHRFHSHCSMPRSR